MGPAALYSIVSAESMATAIDGTSYPSGGVYSNTFDEVLLVDANGRPAAIPVVDEFLDDDHVYEVADGSLARTPNAMLHSVTLKCSNLPNDVGQRLASMRDHRTRVKLSPGFGPHSEFAYRPRRRDPSTVSADLTGRYAMLTPGRSSSGFLWDDINSPRGFPLASPGANNPWLIATPTGAGQVFERAVTNLSSPATPVSGTHGWTYPAGLSAQYVAEGFGASAAPHSYRFYNLEHSNPWTGALTRSETIPSSAGMIDLTVWLKGRVPNDTVFSAVTAGFTGGDATDISGLDLSEWTPIRMRFLDSGGATTISISISISARRDYESTDLEVGPIMLYKGTSSSGVHQPNINWTPSSSAVSKTYAYTVSSVNYPSRGTVFSSFYVPPWFDQNSHFNCGITGAGSGGGGSVRLINYSGNPVPRAVWYGDTGDGFGEAVNILAGKTNTIAATWTNDEQIIYFNGEEVGKRSAQDFSVGQQSVYLGDCSYGEGMWPLVMNTFRLEADVWGGQMVRDMHFSLSDPGAMAPVVAARGRTYDIVELPTKVVVANGDAYWRGNLKLRQASYSRWESDITTCDGDYL